METEKNYHFSERKRKQLEHKSAINYNFRLDNHLFSKLLNFSKKKNTNTSKALRWILNEFFNKVEKVDLENKTNQKIDNLQKLNSITNETLRSEMFRIKQALFAIGKSSPISSKKIKELFKDENLD